MKMVPEIRIKTILLTDKIRKDKDYAKKLSIEDVSYFKKDTGRNRNATV